MIIRVQDHSVELDGTRFISCLTTSGEGFDDRLRAIVLERERSLVESLEHTTVAGITRGTTSTWKQHNVLEWPHEECSQLRRLIAESVRGYVERYELPRIPRYIQCWCNVLRSGESFDLHDHTDASGIAGVYYLDAAGSEHEAGRTYYQAGDDEWLEVARRPGMLNLFQGDLPHFVSTWLGREARVTIAFDVVAVPSEGHRYLPLQ